MEGEAGWRSCVFGAKQPAPVFRVRREGLLPATLATAIDFSDSPGQALLELEANADRRILCYGNKTVVFD